LRWFAPLVLMAGLLLAPIPGEAQLSETDSLTVRVDRLFASWARSDGPGAAVVVTEGDRTLHLSGYGAAVLEHRVPIEGRTVFDVASVAKQFTAYLVALMEEEGLLSVDDLLRDHLPEFSEMADDITLRHLLHHTGGLRDWPGALFLSGSLFEDVLTFNQILRMALHQTDLNFAPGTEHDYSNTGYNLLAEVISRRVGQPFPQVAKERIFEPLQMTSTRFLASHGEVVQLRADSYAPVGGGAREYRRVASNLSAWGSSSLLTSAEDMARWMIHLNQPGSSAGERVVERMEERGVLTGGDTIAYGWGQWEGEIHGQRALRHGGSWAGYRSTVVRLPDREVGIAVLGNSAALDPESLAEEIAAIYLEETGSATVARIAPPRLTRVEPAREGGADGPRGADSVGGFEEGGEASEGPWSPTTEELGAYAGEYRSPELYTFYAIHTGDGGLVATHFRLGSQFLRPVAPDRFESVGLGDVTFQRDGEGRVIGFTSTRPRIRDLRFIRVRP